MGRLWYAFLIAATWSAGAACAEPPVPTPPQDLAPLEEVVRAHRDLWGEAALRCKDGPSYEFFEKLLPPLCYVNAAFRHYPIVLSAPAHAQKARFISNGSGVNLSAEGAVGWHDVGFPVTFRVGDREELYGRDLARLDGPRLDRGYLPIIRLRYREHGAVYEQEAFAAAAGPLADQAAVFVRFRLLEANDGEVTAAVRFSKKMVFDGRALRDPEGKVLLLADGDGQWQPTWKLLRAPLTRERELNLILFTEPLESGLDLAASPATYAAQRRECLDTWQAFLERGMQVEVPEPVVNHAWRTMLIGLYTLVRGNVMCYSSDNQYQGVYVAEGSDAVRALMLWGFTQEALALMPSLVESARPGLDYHRAGMKLQMVNHYYWLTRDADSIERLRDLWLPELTRLLTDREAETGLFPRERYCGDVGTQVYNLRSNANAWRGLRDTAAMLAELGDTAEAERAFRSAAQFRAVVLEAARKSEYLGVEPPFIPIALFGEEKPYDVLTADKDASYYNLVVPYTIASGVFGVGAAPERWMIEYLQQHGGLCMGMIRSRPNGEFWVQKSNVVELYTRRYTLALLQNDDVDRALVGFYGKLAQGCTRDTFMNGEGSCLVPLDAFGRQMYLPPNSTAYAHLLWLLRYLLIQDWDLDDDGKPETLRLLFATPRRWLETGKAIAVSNAPTAFGRVSVAVQSRLDRGEVRAEVTLPPYPAQRILLRARVPDAWEVASATIDGAKIRADPQGTVDLSGRRGSVAVRFQVQRKGKEDAKL